MVFIRGLKGKNGFSDNMRRAGSQRRHIYTGKMSKKSPASTPAHTAARPPLPRTSKDKDRVQFNVEPLSDDESDDPRAGDDNHGPSGSKGSAGGGEVKKAKKVSKGDDSEDDEVVVPLPVVRGGGGNRGGSSHGARQI